MGTPEFIVRLRERVGHDVLWLPGVTAVVVDDDARVLLVQRADTGAWALPSGIPEPGEEMAAACAREVVEETGVSVAVEHLLDVTTLPQTRYPNGDRCQFVDHVFDCRPVSGRAHVADDESLAVTWCAVADLAGLGLPPRSLDLVALAASTGDGTGTRFDGASHRDPERRSAG